MNHDAFLGAITRDAAALASAATGRLDQRVPPCADWTLVELVDHLSSAHRMATLAVGRDAPDFFGLVPSRPADEEPTSWLREGASALVGALRDPEAPAWTWLDAAGQAAFWARRMAHETAVHRWDGEAAAGDPAPVDGELAADGVEEFFDILRHRPADRFGPAPAGKGETVHLHCTDRDAEWLIRLEPEGFTVAREHSKGDVAARGAASDLFLVLLGRLPPSSVELLGDAAILERWQEQARF